MFRRLGHKNARKKISNVGERAMILQLVGDIMYGNGNDVDNDPVDWALAQVDMITTTMPQSSTFMKYMNSPWRTKVAMWCVGVRRIPHVGLDINVAIEPYHSNLKNVLNVVKECFVGRHMDWLIYHLIGYVIAHY